MSLNRSAISELSKTPARLSAWAGVLLFALSGCGSLPEPGVKTYAFPSEGVFIDRTPTRKFEKLGIVRVKVNYTSLNSKYDEDSLCANYYNKGVRDLLAKAREQKKADAVIEVKSISFYMDGSHDTSVKPACSDDGSEGQVLLQGTAIRYLRPKKMSAADLKKWKAAEAAESAAATKAMKREADVKVPTESEEESNEASPAAKPSPRPIAKPVAHPEFELPPGGMVNPGDYEESGARSNPNPASPLSP